jgi:hypothetical protein
MVVTKHRYPRVGVKRSSSALRPKSKFRYSHQAPEVLYGFVVSGQFAVKSGVVEVNGACDVVFSKYLVK